MGGCICFVLEMPGEVVNASSFCFVAVVKVGEELSEGVSPFFAVFEAFELVGDFCRCWGFRWFVKVPVLPPGLFEKFLVFAVPSLLFLVFFEADLVGKLEHWVVRGVVSSFAESVCFLLRFSRLVWCGCAHLIRAGARSSSVVKFISRRSLCHCPICAGCQYVGMRVFPVRGGSERVMPHDFSEVSFGLWGYSRQPYWAVVASDSHVGSGAGPELRSEIWGTEKEVNHRGFFVLKFSRAMGCGCICRVQTC